MSIGLDEKGIANLYLLMYGYTSDTRAKHDALTALIRFIYDAGIEVGRKDGIEEGKKLGQPRGANVDVS